MRIRPEKSLPQVAGPKTSVILHPGSTWFHAFGIKGVPYHSLYESVGVACRS